MAVSRNAVSPLSDFKGYARQLLGRVKSKVVDFVYGGTFVLGTAALAQGVAKLDDYLGPASPLALLDASTSARCCTGIAVVASVLTLGYLSNKREARRANRLESPSP